MIIPLYNSLDKTLYDLTFARRFLLGKQMIQRRI